MKCENWSNKVNNFVVRKLKSFKLNGQQQVLSTMPAMPKEKSSPVPLTECNFVEMKMKEHLTGTTTTAAATTAKLMINSTNKMPENILTDCNNTTIQQRLHQQQHQLQQQQQQQQQEQENNQQLHKTTPIQHQTITGTTKLFSSSSCNDICSTSNKSNNCTIRTSSVSERAGINKTTTTNDTSTSNTTSTSLLNGSTTNFYNSKNDINNKILNNGIIKNTFINKSGLLGSNCCSKNNNNVKNTIQTTTTIQTTSKTPMATDTTINNLRIPSTTMAAATIAVSSSSSSALASTISQQQQPTSSSSSSSSSPLNTSIKSNLSAIKNNTISSTPTTPRTASVPVKKSAKDYIFGKIIGEGSFSTVCLARDIHTNREYAIKICYKPHILREKKQEYVRREREIMHIMNNVPGFVHLSCTFQDYRNLYFVMTLAKNGDLLPYINKVGSFDLDCTRHYAAELVLSIENMHKRGVIHRDLKPENILLDEKMHTLIADFGSAKIFDINREKEILLSSTSSPSPSSSSASSKISAGGVAVNDSSSSSSRGDGNVVDNNEKMINDRRMDSNKSNEDDYDNNDDSPRPIRKRRGSFVGTAQYVSPEVLQGEIVTRSADLWALGCIIYQMISGLPPFRGGSDYLIFKEIMNLNLIFPEGFDKKAENLVRNLLKLNPNERIGANDNPLNKYDSIRSHTFFDGIEWDKIRQKSPPQIYPYLPGVCKDEELRSHYRVPDNLEPGLDDKQLTRLLGLELGTIVGKETTYERKIVPKNNLNIIESEKQKRLELQKLSDKWHQYSEGEIILKKGFINKRKGLFARKRMLLLTTGPKLIYIDPVQMIKKGEIPWSPALRVEPKNFKIFFVHTPNRTYYLEDPEGYALEWVNAIEDVRQKTYGDKL